MRTRAVPVFVVFLLNGIIAGSWAARMPSLAEQIGASPGVLGLVLLGASVGLAAAASVAGRLCARFGARVMILVSAVAAGSLLPVLALVTSPVQLALVLVLLGASFGVFDVSINVAAVTVIRRADRPLMPVFHAGFSFGALGGSLAAAVAAGHRVDLLRYFTLVALVSLAVTAVVIRFVPTAEPATGALRERGGLDRSMLRRPVLWLLGSVAFISAVVEGSNGDWSALFAVRERGMSEAAGAIMYSVFCLAMGVVRLFGERIQRRFGAIRILVAGSLLAGIGLLMAAIVPVAWLTYAGYVLAGGGVAFAFPVVIELAGAVGRRSDGTGGEREIGFVTTIAYSGFLIGPPMIGGVAELTNLSVAVGFIGVVAMLMVPAALAAAAARRREDRGRRTQTEPPRDYAHTENRG
ncbi:Nitrate/nitrite transporter NarK [Micromonospora coriariae]|uniref:Nitrate/nitrite transporter NarK n=1 Tax=Micromonospora coriariae TaxID=285665 RepID=A0A1C4VD90_9ACTN|nr:MFS transporter [Micromonospora coriariae]SCE81902.1 Nitrate/nitrite transporter NarK [Micromonospora coriariae]